MIDPPRPEAIAVVRACQAAGIAVKMITGDHALTAVAVARQLGLSGSVGAPAVVIGQELAACPDADLPALADRTAVFARVAPEQKLRLVKALHASGHVVAMTGDGVNDAPALRQADIGVAMGRGGTDGAIQPVLREVHHPRMVIGIGKASRCRSPLGGSDGSAVLLSLEELVAMVVSWM